MKGRTPSEVLSAFPVVHLDNLLWNISGIPWDNSPKNARVANETQAYYLLRLALYLSPW
ncbi:MAG: hypothetical protein H5U36_08685 [Candidatus Caldatribacterium sp.]|nr:hypothetical protein [Candidatus Caldatribacterium sp.]